ncbi:MAG: hypothetical protein F4Z90_00785 [Acidimicrobiaceae bacterium]|nr:hypothetical protein [Acidimicrobiaceae bacterium]MYB86487.1 hypothetical protein [Acidimicrobiaceae bacterium]
MAPGPASRRGRERRASGGRSGGGRLDRPPRNRQRPLAGARRGRGRRSGGRPGPRGRRRLHPGGGPVDRRLAR